jgi:putative lipoic acid-binding regulatory protein
MIRQNIIPQQDGNTQGVEYPVVFHYRVITDSDADAEPALAQAVGAYQVASPLTLSRASSGGRYTAYSVSIVMQSCEEAEAFDAAIKKIPGVRMLL